MTTVVAPASVEQRLLWYMDHYRGAGGVLNCPVLLRADGLLDRPALARALDRLAARHESLHTTFDSKGRHLARVIHPCRALEIIDVDLRTTADPEAAVRHAIASELHTWIDPAMWPVRVTLWRLSETTHVLCVNMHHLAVDGWSCGVIFNDLLALYGGECGEPTALSKVHWQYSDYVNWQQELMAGDGLAAHREYWKEQLLGVRLPPLPLRPANAEPPQPAQASVTIEPQVCDAIRRMARERRTTVFAIMLSLYYTVIHRLTGATDLSVTSLFANRLRSELAGTVGPFSNMLILRTQMTSRATFGDVLRDTHATVVGAFLHQAVPFQALPGLAVQSDGFRADDVVFHMTADRLRDARMGTVQVRALPFEGVGNRFALEVVVMPKGDELTTVVSYNERRINRAWIALFVEEYAALAANVATLPGARVWALASQALS